MEDTMKTYKSNVLGRVTVPDYPEFTEGEKVADRYGKRHTVLVQRGCQVFTTDGGWIHPSNLRRAK